MNAVPQRHARTIVSLIGSLCLASSVLGTPCFAGAYGQSAGKPTGGTVKVSLSEWKVQLTPARIPPGPVVFEVRNDGTIPHAFEVEGHGLEKSSPQIQPGTTATLKVDLRAGSYEAYRPVGKGSHKMLGMMNHLMVGDAKRAAATDEEHEKDEKYEAGHDAAMEQGEHEHGEESWRRRQDDEGRGRWHRDPDPPWTLSVRRQRHGGHQQPSRGPAGGPDP